jgi:drug/metabolite transporter (DMT)-like permease
MNTTAEITAKSKRKTPSNLILILVMGVFAIASSSIFIRYAQAEGMSSLLIGAARLIISALLVTPIVISRHRDDLARLTRSDWFWASVGGFFLAIHFAAWVSSLEYTSVLISTVVVTSSVIWVALLEFIFLKVSPTRLVLLGLVVAVAGGIIIALGSVGGTNEQPIDNGRNLIGIFLSLIGSIAVAVYFVVGRKLRTVLPIIPYVWVIYGIGGIILGTIVVLRGEKIFGFENIGYLWLLCCAIFPQLIGHSSLNYAVGYLPATLVSMITQLEPLGSAILAFFLFQEVPLPVQILGSAVLLCGVMMASFGQSQPQEKAKNDA